MDPMRSVIALLVVSFVAPAHADSKCAIEKPVAIPKSTAKAPPCHRASKAVEKAITAKIAKDYEPTQKGKPEVKFACDGLGAKVYEIVVETGGGHGGSLDLWRAKRRTDGKFDVRGILYRGNSMVHKAAAVPHEQAAGIVVLPDLDKVRAALTATVHEVIPPPPKGGSWGMSGSSSSHDFRILIRLVDDDGRVVEGEFTGYEGSSSQDTYLPLEVAAEALTPITSLAADPKLAADGDDKLFFAASFNAMVPHFDEPFHWWVMERYVDLARFLGTPSVIEGLLTRLANKKTDRSAVDAKADAVDALARITGWDARSGGKTVDQAAAAYLADCK
jgi:hypothetical protein